MIVLVFTIFVSHTSTRRTFSIKIRFHNKKGGGFLKDYVTSYIENEINTNLVQN